MGRLAGSNGAANVRNFLLMGFYVSCGLLICKKFFCSFLIRNPCRMNPVVALLVVAGAAGLYLWNLGKAAGNLIYIPGTITSFSLNGISPEIAATLVIQNTSNITFTINSLAAVVTSDDTQIGNVSSFVPTSIPANGQATVPIILTLQPIGIVNEIIQLITGGSGKRDMAIKGTVNANGMQQSFSVEYKIGT